jgi:hypothetical protein
VAEGIKISKDVGKFPYCYIWRQLKYKGVLNSKHQVKEME